jgi:hypothetical protein
VLVLGNLTCNAISLALHYNKPLINGSLCHLLLLGEIWGSLSCFHLWDNWQEVAIAGPHFSITKTENLPSTFPDFLNKKMFTSAITRVNQFLVLLRCFAIPFLSMVTTRRSFSSDAARVMQTSSTDCAKCYSSKIASTSKLSKWEESLSWQKKLL